MLAKQSNKHIEDKIIVLHIYIMQRVNNTFSYLLHHYTFISEIQYIIYIYNILSCMRIFFPGAHHIFRPENWPGFIGWRRWSGWGQNGRYRPFGRLTRLTPNEDESATAVGQSAHANQDFFKTNFVSFLKLRKLQR